MKRVQPEEEALRENLSKVTAEDMKVDVLEDREPMQPTLPSIPLDQVRDDEPFPLAVSSWIEGGVG